MYENEFQVRTRDGDYRYFHVQAVPILSSGGEVGEWIGAAVDITQQKEVALAVQRHRDELAHVTRIATMGELAASLAHELNQPLTAILSNAQAAQRFLAAGPAALEELREILEDIVQDDNRASEVIQRLRAMVKKEELAFTPLDIAGVVRDVAGLVHSDAILHGVPIVLELDAGLTPVLGDKVQLQQVMLNLLLNAFDAMKDVLPSEREVVVKADSDGAERVAVSVRDRGTGLASDKLETIFQPFFTTKKDGLGMGLSISRSIVEAHGGRLWAENNRDGGATFHVVLPAVPAAQDKLQDAL
jgi:two-component system sensor kinase FixL